MSETKACESLGAPHPRGVKGVISLCCVRWDMFDKVLIQSFKALGAQILGPRIFYSPFNTSLHFVAWDDKIA